MKLCMDLVRTLQDEYQEWLDTGNMSEGEFFKEIKLVKFDPAFNFIGKLFGHKGRTLRRIEDETRSKVTIDQPDDFAPISITVSADNKEFCDHGMNLCKDLVRSLRVEYQEWVDKGSSTRLRGLY